MDPRERDQRVINALRFLAIDAIERARSGHPGMPMGAAPMAYVLWDRFLQFNPTNPSWPNRDRFVLSAGHGSMLLYALLYLTGFDLNLEDLKNFRQLDSRTPGHPEYGLTPGVEATTGPLGQGFANSVGMALAEAHLAAVFNRPGFPLVDHYTYVIASDGDLMEGISCEAAQLAGRHRLGKLIVLWDHNEITIDGPTQLAWREDVLRRFQAFGWHTLRVEDGNDLEALDRAIRTAREERDRPTIIAVRTHIGYGSPLQDNPRVHGSPLGPEAVAETRRRLNWPYGPFEVPEDVLTYMRRHRELGQQREAKWQALLAEYEREYPDLARKWQAHWAGTTTQEASGEAWANFRPEDGPLATRKASQKVLNRLFPSVPNLIGGSADLTDSNGLRIQQAEVLQPEHRQGRYLHFGIREHGMAGILNGIAYHGGLIPFGGTFLVFSDYLRPALRVAAMSRLHVIFVFSHDSIALGEDGPTHQPIEQLPSLRMIPNLLVLRPADANETAYAWEIALKTRHRPVALILTRQGVPILDRTKYPDASWVRRGAYVLADAPGEGPPELLLMASGSEVHVALEAHHRLVEQGVRVRTVNFFSWELFEERPEAYRRQVLPPEVRARLAIEAARPEPWYRYVGLEGRVIGMTTFGKSAPYREVYRHFGFTPERVVEEALRLLRRA